MLYYEFAGKITFQDGRYKVALLLKEFHESLADNYLLSVRRLRGLFQRLKHDPEILKEYDRVIQKQLAKGVIEPVTLMKRPPIKCTISLTTVWSAFTWTSACTKDPNFTSLFLILSFDSYPTKLPSLPMWRRHSSWLQSMRRTVMFPIHLGGQCG